MINKDIDENMELLGSTVAARKLGIPIKDNFHFVNIKGHIIYNKQDKLDLLYDRVARLEAIIINTGE